MFPLCLATPRFDLPNFLVQLHSNARRLILRMEHVIEQLIEQTSGLYDTCHFCSYVAGSETDYWLVV